MLIKSLVLKKLPRIAMLVTPKLRNVSVELTNSCNLSCQMCYSRNRPKGFMDFELFKRIIQELNTIQSVENVILNYGGESLLHPEISDLIRYVVSPHPCYQVGLHTNGLLLRNHQDCLMHLDWVSVSLDGVGEVNDRIRKGASYPIIEQNILSLLQLRQGSKPKIILNLTWNQQTVTQVNEFVEKWSKLVDKITVNSCVNQERQWTPSPSLELKPTNLRFCSSPFNYLGILWNGDVVACINDLDGKNIIGNLDHEVYRVWRGKEYRKFRYCIITEKLYEYPLCSTCELWKSVPINLARFDAIGSSLGNL